MRGLQRGLVWLGTAWGITMALGAAAVEELAYEVERQFGDVEIRRLADHVTAAMLVTESFEEAGNVGFRPLADYIFGGNEAGMEIAMTAPVLQSPGAREGQWEVAFVMPREHALDALPAARDDRVAIERRDPKRMAVIGYRGGWSQERFDRYHASLRAQVEAAGMQICGAPVWARYNPPFWPWFMRRNEIWLPVADPEC